MVRIGDDGPGLYIYTENPWVGPGEAWCVIWAVG